MAAKESPKLQEIVRFGQCALNVDVAKLVLCARLKPDRLWFDPTHPHTPV